LENVQAIKIAIKKISGIHKNSQEKNKAELSKRNKEEANHKKKLTRYIGQVRKGNYFY
jgi:hypothetical protein